MQSAKVCRYSGKHLHSLPKFLTSDDVVMKPVIFLMQDIVLKSLGNASFNRWLTRIYKHRCAFIT